MGTLTAKSAIEAYFISNWTATTIQFDGSPFDYSGLQSWISIVYSPAINTTHTKSGRDTPAILREGVLKVFCYAKSVPLAFSLTDSVQTFLNHKTISDVHIEVGMDSMANNLANGYFEVPVKFTTRFYE